MKALALALILTIPTIDESSDSGAPIVRSAAETIRQTIDETGVYIGAYYGCYNDDTGELVCILPPEENQDETQSNPATASL